MTRAGQLPQRLSSRCPYLPKRFSCFSLQLQFVSSIYIVFGTSVQLTVTMSPVGILVLTLNLLVVSALPTNSPSTVDVTDSAKQLVEDVRTLVSHAKNGISLESLHRDVLELQGKVSDLLVQLPGEVPKCETKHVIKMAAAGTGSHEVLTVMLAQDALSVLNGRLSLSLAFLDHVAQQMEDELTLSKKVGPHLDAIVFGTNVTATIASTADKTVKTMISSAQTSDSSRVRRQSIILGSGFSLSNGGVTWQNGNFAVNVKPHISGIKIDGAVATLTFSF